MPKHTLYFSDATFNIISPDPLGAEGLSTRVSRLCAIAIDVMDENIPTLSFGEWMTFIEVAHDGSYICQNENTPRDMVKSFQFSIRELGFQCDEKWEVNCVALAKKYAALPLVAKLAAIEVCRRYWTRREVNAKYHNQLDILSAHGAKFED